jgi:outer membrane protein assembly factor BamB
MTKPLWRCLLLAVVSIPFAAICQGSENWLQFRGNQGTGAVDFTAVPLQFSAEGNQNIAWKSAVPGRGVNGPIVVNGQVIVTSSSGKDQQRLHVISIDSETGKQQWERRFWATGRTLCHPLSAVASPTPASDGQRIFAMFASNDLFCLDLQGNVQWIRSLAQEHPGAFDDRGLASSPCVIADTVIVQIACQGDSFVMGISASDGTTKWQVPLAKTTCWTSPIPVHLAGRALAVVQSADQMLVVEPDTGEVQHTYSAEGNLIPSPVQVDGTILLPAEGMTAIKLDPSGEQADVLWQEAKVGAASASPVGANGRFYVIRPPNVITAVNLADADVLWKTRLKGNGYWATPLLCGSHLFVTCSEGSVQVVDVENGKVISENELGGELLGSPAAVDGAIYWRSTSHLWKVQATP